MYRFIGRRQLLRLDFVQFFYMFVCAPLLFVWGKSFLFFLMRNEVDIRLSQTELFIVDTAFSLIALYIFAFVVIHSVTKTFNVRSSQDPLYDIFSHSEYFHLWLTHLVMYGGGMLLLTLIGLANVAFPLDTDMPNTWFYVTCVSGIFSGTIIFLGVWLSDPKQARNFMRIMKLLYGIFFIIHVMVYFTFNPYFSPNYLLFWWSLLVFATTVSHSLFAYKSVRAKSFIERFSDRFKHGEWDFRIQLFSNKK